VNEYEAFQQYQWSDIRVVTRAVVRAVNSLGPRGRSDVRATLSQGVDAQKTYKSCRTLTRITLLCGRLSANAACLCCRTRRAGRAPSGTSTCLWPIHLKSTLQVFVGAFTAESWRLLGAYRCRTPRKVKGHGGVGNREVRRGLGFSASDESDARFGSLGLIRWDAARVKYSLPDL
jgi:hypothetical protein